MVRVHTAAIALGSNLGDRRENIELAIERIGELEGTSFVARSSLHETRPVGIEDQPDFLNACCVVSTSLSPRALLGALQEIERGLGRDRSHEQRWGPRMIDLDLLLVDDLVIDEPALTIPHPRMHERAFVLEPLAEIAGELVHPVLSATIRALRERLRIHLGGSVPPVGANLLA